MPVRFRYVRGVGPGRIEVRCVHCGRFFWLTTRELFEWTVCPHCVGWWRLGMLYRARTHRPARPRLRVRVARWFWGLRFGTRLLLLLLVSWSAVIGLLLAAYWLLGLLF